MATPVPVMIGAILDKGNNEVVVTHSNRTYLNANPGARYIPEGHFCRFDGTDGTDNMVIADKTNAYCISLGSQRIDTLIPNWGSNEQAARYAKQSFCLRAINIVVAFEDADIGNGNIGDPVYVSSNGKATLSGSSTQLNIGILKSPVLDSGYDSWGIITGALAYIDFYQPQLTLGTSARAKKSKKNTPSLEEVKEIEEFKDIEEGEDL